MKTQFAALLVLIATTTAVQAKETPITYALGKGTSEIAYDMVHPMHKIHGVAKALSGRLIVADGHLVTPTSLKLSLITFDSGNANRDGNAALTLDVAKFPHAILEITRVTETANALEGTTRKIAGTATGRLTLHGITKPVTVPITAAVTPAQLTVDAAFSVLLTDYQIPRPSLLFRPVDDEVKITVHAVAAAK